MESNWFSKLNEQQQKAVSADMGPVAVIAGAGTGKTHALTCRFIYVVQTFGLLPKRILAVTFTNKAATEMRTRIKEAIHQSDLDYICTFHSLCVRILRSEITRLGRNKNFNILDEESQTSLLKEIYKEKGIATKDLPLRKMVYLIETWKTKGYSEDSIEDVLNEHTYYGFATTDALRIAYSVYVTYLQECIALNEVDFQDLLLLAYKILATYPDARKKWRNMFDYIMVDESQDINDIQYQLILLLLNDNHDLFIVGDPDQTIYSWRGASSQLFHDLLNKFPNMQLIILEQNYRSTSKILQAANLLIKENPDRFKKDLFTKNEEGNKLIIYQAISSLEEGEWIARKVEHLLKEPGINPKDICVLYRAKHLSRSIEQALIARNIVYKVVGGFKFYERKEIKDLLAYLKVINNGDVLSLKRIANIPRRKITTGTIDLLNQYSFKNNVPLLDAFRDAKKIEGLSSVAQLACVNFYNMIMELRNYQKNHSLVELFDKVYTTTQYKSYLIAEDQQEKEENITELKEAIAFYEEHAKDEKPSLDAYLQDVALYSLEETQKESEEDKVLLMTVHQAKGLEFDYVFLSNFTDDNFPNYKAQEEEGGIEEERRIAYVAMTRARKQLYVSMNNEMSMTTHEERVPSRFLKPIEKHKDDNLFEYDQEIYHALHKDDLGWYDSKQKVDINAMYNEPTYDFKVGDHIIHTMFGEGKVLDVTKDTIKVLFDNNKAKGIKTLAKYHKAIKRVLN